MRIRPKKGGAVVNVPDGQAKLLIRSGTYRAAEEDDAPVVLQPSATTPPPESPKRRYRRRDMRPEK